MKGCRSHVRSQIWTEIETHQHARALAGYPGQDELFVVDLWCDGLGSEGMKEYVLLQEPALWLRA